MHFSSGPHKITIKSNVTKTDQNWQALPRGRNCQLDSSKLQNWVVGPDPARTSLTQPSLQTHSQKWQVCAPPTRTTQLICPDWTSQLVLNFINPHKPFKSHFWGFFLEYFLQHFSSNLRNQQWSFCPYGHSFYIHNFSRLGETAKAYKQQFCSWFFFEPLYSLEVC